MPNSFTGLTIWQKSHKLTLEIYQITSDWPKEEIYGLISQIRRAAVSTELIIAEGHSRYYPKDIIRFMYDSRASAEEVRNCLMIARDINKFNVSLEKFKMLNEEYLGLIRGINSFINSQKKGMNH